MIINEVLKVERIGVQQKENFITNITWGAHHMVSQKFPFPNSEFPQIF